MSIRMVILFNIILLIILLILVVICVKMWLRIYSLKRQREFHRFSLERLTERDVDSKQDLEKKERKEG
jgi:predicted Holliday junction resolvase-like endonuclease